MVTLHIKKIQHNNELMEHLIFDFDCVIGDTKDASARATAKVDNVDVETAFQSNQKYAHNKPRHVRNHTLTDEEMSHIYNWTSQFGELMKASNFPLFSDFVDAIEKIETSHKAVVSSGSQKYVIPSLAKTKINPTHILAYEDHHSKEDKIETICKDWGVSIADVFYFTDTLADIYELKDMITPGKLIAVSWGYCKYDVLAKELPEKYILKTPQDIHKIFTYA